MRHFNSIKVRLKLTLPPRVIGARRFQFHKGTIKTHSSFSFPKRNELFQFHKGTIKTQPTIIIIKHFIDFNSIKVRLKLSVFTVFEHLSLFQFHKGTIKTLLLLCLKMRLINFNSIKVRLKLSILVGTNQ